MALCLKTIELADKLGVTYPVAYGLEAEAISRLTGSFYEKEKRYLQPTGIIVRPDKNVEMAVYNKRLNERERRSFDLKI